MTFEISILFLAGAVMFMAALIKGVSGFGTAIFAVPLLTAFFFVPADTRVIVVSLNLVLNIFILTKEKNLTLKNLSNIRTLIIAGFIFAFLTGFFLPVVDERLFKIILGILLVATALNKLLELPYRITRVKRYFIPVGILSGIMNTLVGVGGIPVLIYLSNTRMRKNDFRMTLMLFFLMINTGSVIGFAVNQQYAVHNLAYTAGLLPFVVVGSLAGMTLVRHINNYYFHKIIAILLLFMGIASITGLI